MSGHEHDATDERIPEAASAWVGSGSPEPKPAAVEEWLAESPTHEAVLLELEEIWDLTRAPTPPPGIWDEVRRRMDEDRAPAARGSSPEDPRGRRLLATAALVVLGLGLGLLWPRVQAAFGPAPELVEVEVPAGATTNLVLPGGVTARLNSASRLAYLPDAKVVEEVTLEGEAYFTVAHDPDRVFRVVTDAGVIRDLGTEFNVYSREGAVTVAVAQGEVELEAAGHAVRVREGEESTAHEGRSPEPVRPADLGAVTAWLEGAIVFQDEPLSSIAAELEHRYGVRFIVAPSLEERRVTATVRGVTAEKAARLICSVVQTRCQSLGDGWIIGDA